MTNHSHSLQPLLALLGPTAVGKTAISLEIAQRIAIEIVSADSRLVYKGLDIGTAKPTQKDREQIPHHLIDISTPKQPLSLAEFRLAANAAIGEVHDRGGLPMLVGGTGQYITAILEGWRPPPRGGTDEFRIQMEQVADKEGSAALHQRLAEVDPVAARHIDHRNIRRVIRALEILHVTGVPASEQRHKVPPPYRILRIGLTLPRDELYARVDARIEHMLDLGWVDEVRELLEAGYDFRSPPFSAIGYRQIARHVKGEIALEQSVGEIKQLTRRFIRRQANWFKLDDPRIHWFESDSPLVVEAICALIGRWQEGSSLE
jgi:tRNA dimethylallyltransferase